MSAQYKLHCGNKHSPQSQSLKVATLYFFFTLNVHFMLDMVLFHIVYTLGSRLMKKPSRGNVTLSVCARGKGKTWWIMNWLLQILFRSDTDYSCPYFIGQDKSNGHS